MCGFKLISKKPIFLFLAKNCKKTSVKLLQKRLFDFAHTLLRFFVTTYAVFTFTITPLKTWLKLNTYSNVYYDAQPCQTTFLSWS